MRQKIESFCKQLGLDTIGFIPCRRFDELEAFYQYRQEKNLQNEFEGKVLEQRLNPKHYLANGKTIISIAFPYDYEEIDAVEKMTSRDNGFSIYTKRLDYHRVVKKYLEQIVLYIQELGGQAIALVDSNTLPERYIAYLAGIGFIGKNNMLITKQYGSYVFLGEIITDLEIPCEDQRTHSELTIFAECGQCENCLKECPTKSINKSRCNPNICLSYLTQKKALTTSEIKLLKGNIFGCDFCQLRCPYNEAAQKSALQDFIALAYMEEEPSIYAEMNNQFFKEKISGTSCGWRGKNVIRRNAIIRMAYEGKEVQGFLGESPYINEYVQKLIEISTKA